MRKKHAQQTKKLIEANVEVMKSKLEVAKWVKESVKMHDEWHDLSEEHEEVVKLTTYLQRKLALSEEAPPEECCVCSDARRSHAMIPCGHRCVCAGCATENFSTCPICRAVVENVVEIYG
jgi:hypothetical protein